MQRLEAADASEVFERYKLETGERTAALEKDAANARLELARLQKTVGPRYIDGEPFLKYLADNKKPTIPVRVLYARDDQESGSLASQIFGALQAAGWPVAPGEPIPPADSRSYFSSTAAIGGVTAGVGVVENAGRTSGCTFGGALKVALGDALGQVNWGQRDELPLGAVIVVVAPKPPGPIFVAPAGR